MPMKSSNKFDRLFWILFFCLTLVIGFLLIRGDQSYPRVVDTNLKNESLPLSTNQIVLTFNRNMDHASVENHFSITPKIEGKFSWIGKKMAFSFKESLASNQSISIELSQAEDELGNLMQSYQKNYQTQSQFLYFIGSEKDQKDQLVGFDLNQEKTTILSPKNLVIKDFRVHPDQNLIYLLGYKKSADETKNNLYELDRKSGRLKVLVDGQKEYIFAFELSPDGNILLARKGSINPYDQSSLVDPGSLWTYEINRQKWTIFWNKELYGSEFYFSPDSNYLVGRMITGDITILPVIENPDKVVYLENYAGNYNLSPNGRQLVFVDFPDPFSPNDLLLRNNDGTTQTLVEKGGQIQFPIFNKNGNRIYFLMSKVTDDFEETGLLSISPFHLYAYDLEQQKLIQLTDEEKYFEGFFHLSTDGKWVAFERYEAAESGQFFEQQLDENSPGAELWIYDTAKNTPKNLGIHGTKPFLN